jgi:hypothetical protein
MRILSRPFELELNPLAGRAIMFADGADLNGARVGRLPRPTSLPDVAARV